MSIWFIQKEKKGSVNIISAEIPLFLILILLGIIAGYLGLVSFNSTQKINAAFFNFSFFLVMSGFGAVLISKISLFRKGFWKSWGSNLMTKPFKLIYRAGYSFLCLGMIFILISYFR
jgi:hypothetical protein